MKTDLLQSCSHCCVFQICWHIECSTFTASSFRIWNTSAGIPSFPLALLVVMLPETHLTLYSRMSGSRWAIIPHGYLGHEDLFCIVLCILATSSLISSASVRSIPFLSFTVYIFTWNVLSVSLISLKRPLVFPVLLFSSVSFLKCWAKWITAPPSGLSSLKQQRFSQEAVI